MKSITSPGTYRNPRLLLKSFPSFKEYFRRKRDYSRQEVIVLQKNQDRNLLIREPKRDFDALSFVASSDGEVGDELLNLRGPELS